MQKNQIIIIGAGLVLLGLLYFFGDRKGPPPEAKEHQHEEAEGGGAAPMVSTNTAEAADFPKLLLMAATGLTVGEQEKFEGLLKASEGKTAVAFKDLGEFWERQFEETGDLMDLNIAAKYYKDGALLENTEKSLTFAGNLMLTLLQKTTDASVRKWQGLEAVECFEKALKINPDNSETKIALANTYTMGTGETMKGVFKLREVVESNPDNIPANVALGKLSVQSGQFDKAIKRFENVLSQDAKNREAMYFLAESYKGKGNKDKAVELFEKCKTLVNEPSFSEEIDNYIKTFK